MLAEIFDDILEKINNTNLEHSLFYRCPSGISALVSNVYFADKEEVFLFHVYDDRGADLVAEDKKTLYPIYQKWKQWILDYDRKIIDGLFLE